MSNQTRTYERPAWMTPWAVTKFHRDNGTNKTGFLGVKKRKSGFEAYITNPEGRQVYCGYGATAEAAALAYDARARALYGPGAVTNFAPR